MLKCDIPHNAKVITKKHLLINYNKLYNKKFIQFERHHNVPSGTKKLRVTLVEDHFAGRPQSQQRLNSIPGHSRASNVESLQPRQTLEQPLDTLLRDSRSRQNQMLEFADVRIARDRTHGVHSSV